MLCYRTASWSARTNMTTTDINLTAQSAVEEGRCSCVETITAAGVTATDGSVHVNASSYCSFVKLNEYRDASKPFFQPEYMTFGTPSVLLPYRYFCVLAMNYLRLNFYI